MSLCARSIALLAALLPAAGATSITILSAGNITQATAERNEWLTETFGAGTTPDPVEVDVDKQSKTLQLLTSFHSLYFFMTAVEGNVQIQTADGTKAHVHDGDNGIYFVGITSSTALGSIQWRSSDSFGLSDFGVPQSPAQAPEPASWLAVATGLAAITRRCRAPSAPS